MTGAALHRLSCHTVVGARGTRISNTPTPRGARRCSSVMPCRRSATPQPLTRCRAPEADPRTRRVNRPIQTRLLIVPTLAWLNVFMEVHMRIKMYLHMAG